MNLSDKLLNKYFDMARSISQLSDYYKQHHLGCVMIYKGKVIADGYNSLKTSPMQKQYNKYREFDEDSPNSGSLHAEMMTLERCKYLDVEWSKVKVFIYREHKSGIKAIAAPCPACRKALIDRGIKHIYYTGENSFIYEIMQEHL